MKINQPIGVSTVTKETKLLAQTALKIAKKHKLKSVLDMGCGTGYVAVYLAQQKLKVEGADISMKAVKASINNAKANKVKARFFQSNLFSKVKRKYDFIIFNAPLGDVGGNVVIDTVKSIIRRIAPLRKIVGKIMFKTALEKRTKLNIKFINQGLKHLNKNGKLLLLIYKQELETISKLKLSYEVIVNKHLPKDLSLLLL